MRKPLFYWMVLSASLMSSAAMAIVWAANPEPGGSTQASVSGTEAKLVTYRVTAQHRDSSTPNGQPSDPVTVTGDPTVNLFQAYQGDPPSGRLVTYAQATYDAVAGTRGYDVTVRLRMVGDNQEASVDPYLAGDTRGPGDPRWDYTAGQGGAQAILIPLNQTVTINPNKATVQGRVTDSATGLPIADANLEYAPTDPGIEDPLMSFGTSNYNGDYVLTGVYAGPYYLSCSSNSYQSQGRSGTVSHGSTSTENFVLSY